jgi:hypothetical protein
MSYIVYMRGLGMDANKLKLHQTTTLCLGDHYFIFIILTTLIDIFIESNRAVRFLFKYILLNDQK